MNTLTFERLSVNGSEIQRLINELIDNRAALDRLRPSVGQYDELAESWDRLLPELRSGPGGSCTTDPRRASIPGELERAPTERAQGDRLILVGPM